MSDRRLFLRGLAALPLVGGAVSLVGRPTAAAVPITPSLLDTYDTWLHFERNYLRWERYGARMDEHSLGAGFDVAFISRATGHVLDPVQMTNPAARQFNRGDPRHRAAVILSAAGVPLPVEGEF